MLPMVKGIRRRNRRLFKKRRLRNPKILTTVERILYTNFYTKHFYRSAQKQENT